MFFNFNTKPIPIPYLTQVSGRLLPPAGGKRYDPDGWPAGPHVCVHLRSVPLQPPAEVWVKGRKRKTQFPALHRREHRLVAEWVHYRRLRWCACVSERYIGGNYSMCLCLGWLAVDVYEFIIQKIGPQANLFYEHFLAWLFVIFYWLKCAFVLQTGRN